MPSLGNALRGSGVRRLGITTWGSGVFVGLTFRVGVAVAAGGVDVETIWVGALHAHNTNNMTSARISRGLLFDLMDFMGGSFVAVVVTFAQYCAALYVRPEQRTIHLLVRLSQIFDIHQFRIAFIKIVDYAAQFISQSGEQGLHSQVGEIRRGE